jgi:hypothetical protein
MDLLSIISGRLCIYENSTLSIDLLIALDEIHRLELFPILRVPANQPFSSALDENVGGSSSSGQQLPSSRVLPIPLGRI